MFDYFLLKFAILFFPGLLWAKIEMAYGTMGNRNYRELLVNAFVFNIVIYTILRIAYLIIGIKFSPFDIPVTTNVDKVDITIFKNIVEIQDEFIVAVMISLLLSLFWLRLNMMGKISIFLKWMKVSSRDRNKDVWTAVHNMNPNQPVYVQLYDIQTKLHYYGKVVAFPEDEEHRELLLQNAKVIDSNEEVVFSCPLLYIARMKSDITMFYPAEETNHDRQKVQA